MGVRRIRKRARKGRIKRRKGRSVTPPTNDPPNDPHWRKYLRTAWAPSYFVTTRLLNARELIRGVELGVASGWHADQILLRCPRAEVIGIDAYHPTTAMTLQRKYTAEQHNATMMKMLQLLQPHGTRFQFIRQTTVDAAALVTGPFDWIYVDASHDKVSVAADLEAWAPKLRPGGLLMGHDYGCRRHTGVKLAVDAFVAARGLHLGGIERSVWWLDLGD